MGFRGEDGLHVPSAAGSSRAAVKERTRLLDYRALMDIAVRYRQLADPESPIFWFDNLPAEDLSESLPTCAGGSMSLATPILNGRKKSTRYYSNYELAFNYSRLAVLRYGYYIQQESGNAYVNTSRLYTKKTLDGVRSLDDLYGLAQRHPHWVMTSVSSGALAMGVLEGSRLSLSGSHAADGERVEYRYDIRTPTTLQRFERWDAYMRERFEGAMRLLSDSSSKLSEHDIVSVALELYYYWVNFAPLTRGTAFTGYSVLYSVILSQGYFITSPLPKDRQLDWEAILLGSLESFIQHQKSWLTIAPCTPKQKFCAGDILDGTSAATNMNELFPTARAVIAALNGGIPLTSDAAAVRYESVLRTWEEETLFEYI